jgi:hypothetical protein
MASSENFSAKSIENSNTISISAGIKSKKAKPAPSKDIYFDASDKKSPSDNFSNFTNAPITESAVEHVAAATVVTEKTYITKCDEELGPTAPSVPESVPSKNISVFTDLPLHLLLNLQGRRRLLQLQPSNQKQ